MGLPVLDYPNYTVCEDGSIYSLLSNKYLKQSKNNRGYMTVELFNKNGSKRLLVHRIVAMAYIPNPDNLPQINHKDEDKANNCVENLEWCTAKYNMNYGNGAKVRHSKIDYSRQSYRENAINNGKIVSVPVLQVDMSGKVVNRFDSISDAERYLRIKHSHISECCMGKRKTSNGFYWKYDRGSDLSDYLF